MRKKIIKLGNRIHKERLKDKPDQELIEKLEKQQKEYFEIFNYEIK